MGLWVKGDVGRGSGAIFSPQALLAKKLFFLETRHEYKLKVN